MNQKVTIVITTVIILIIGTGIGYYFGYDFGYEKAAQPINSFASCAAAGYPIMESYPRQCQVPGGPTFTEVIDGSIGEFWGSIYGVVMLGPTCPVIMDPPDPSCADKPYQTRLVITTADQARVIKEFSSDANGRFNVEVPPGEYAIRSAAAANILPYCSTNDNITVLANAGTEVTVYCDSGVR